MPETRLEEAVVILMHPEGSASDEMAQCDVLKVGTVRSGTAARIGVRAPGE